MIPLESTLNAVWSWLGGNLKMLLIVAGLMLACFFLGQCDGRRTERAKAEAERAQANVAALKQARTADEVAAVERVRDATAIAATETELTDAIADTPDTLPDPTRVQLGCQRLRNQGTPDASLPAACGRAGPDGTQAGSAP